MVWLVVVVGVCDIRVDAHWSIWNFTRPILSSPSIDPFLVRLLLSLRRSEFQILLLEFLHLCIS